MFAIGNSCVRGTDLTVGGKRAEAEGCQPTVSSHGDAKFVAASVAGSADLHHLPKAT